MPSSDSASTATGCHSAPGAAPAAASRNRRSAITERPWFPTQTKSTFAKVSSKVCASTYSGLSSHASSALRQASQPCEPTGTRIRVHARLVETDVSPLFFKRLSDEMLGRRLASGEAAAFDELYRRYANRLAAYGAQRPGDHG